MWQREFGWYGSSMDKQQVKSAEQVINNPNVAEPGGRGYVLLVKEIQHPKMNPSGEKYYLAKPDDLRGLWSVVEQQWQKEKELYKIIEQLKEKKRQILNSQTKLAQDKVEQLVEQIKAFTQEHRVGLGDLDPEPVIQNSTRVVFQRKHYPELEHLAGAFTDDLDNYQLENEYHLYKLPLDHLLDFMEVIYQLKQDKAELEKELDRERKRNELARTDN